MSFTQDHIAESRRRRRIGLVKLKQEDALRVEIGVDPHLAIATGTRLQREQAAKYFIRTGNKQATANRNLDDCDLSTERAQGQNFAGSSMTRARLGYASGSNFNFTRSVGLVTAGGDTSGTSWNGALVIKGDARHSNRRHQNMNGAIVALTDSSGSYSEGLKFHGIGVGNQQGNENLTGATIGGWQVLTNYNGVHAPGSTITGRADFNDYSNGNFSHGHFNVSGKHITTHSATFDEATVSLGSLKNAESANLDRAHVQEDDIRVAVMADMIRRTVRRPAMYTELDTAPALPAAYTLQPKARLAALRF